jgi:hypothetical protein
LVSTPVAAGTAKGTIVRPMVEWLAATHGGAAVERIAAELEPRWLAYLRTDAAALGIVHSRWYDEELASAIAEAILAFVASSDQNREEALAAIGAITVQRSLGRFARAALWFASPEMTARSAQMFWRLHHSRGTISAVVQGTTMTAVGTGWGRHGDAWCSIVGASSVHVLELARCVSPRLERHVCGRGVRPCEMTLRWER